MLPPADQLRSAGLAAGSSLKPPTVERLDIRWVANVARGEAVRDTPLRQHSAATASRLATGAVDWFYGPGPYEIHEGGLWLHDEQGWFAVRNLIGIDPAGIAGLDPPRVDRLRVNARRLYARFPDSARRLHIQELLDTPIEDAAAVQRWVDSICNSSLPMPHRVHGAMLPEGPGIDHYPTPVVDIEFFRRDDFMLWATANDGSAVALAPAAADQPESSMLVLWAKPESRLGRLRAQAEDEGMLLVLDPRPPGDVRDGADHRLRLGGGRVVYYSMSGKASPPKATVVPGGPEVGRHPWARHIAERPRRTDSDQYRHTRETLAPIVDSVWHLLYDRVGVGGHQIHHGGGLWLKDERGWFMVRNLAGIEWSAQFCADPRKVDRLRENARRLYQRFPEAARELGIERLLQHRIRTMGEVAYFCDSVLNASMPLKAAAHNGALPQGAGYHNYPARLCDLQYVVRHDFQLFLDPDAVRANGLAQGTLPMQPARNGLD